MRFKSINSWIVLLLIAVFLVGCSTLQKKWDSATEDERARIIISQFQRTLRTSFDLGKAYVSANPKYQDEWKGKLIPSFDAANKILGDFIARGQRGEKLTVVQITGILAGRIKEITDTLTAWGLKLTFTEIPRVIPTWGELQEAGVLKFPV